MAVTQTHHIRSLSGTPLLVETNFSTTDFATTVHASSVWKSSSPSLKCKVTCQTSDLSDTLSPPISPCRSPIRADLTSACQAFTTASVPDSTMHKENIIEGGSAHNKKEKGVPVYVMMPLDSVKMDNTVNRKKAMNASFQALKSAGVEGIMMDVWWGLVEREHPGEYNWGGYMDLLDMAKNHGLKVQVVMSFHQCGGNVGDSITIPLPKWVVEEIHKDLDLAYTDQWGRRNFEYISLGCDTLPVLKGQTPLQCYADFMRAFKIQFQHLLGNTIVEIQVGMGPAGELRYPSYPEQDGTWKFPGIGAFQCFDKYMSSKLRDAAEVAGKPEWGHSGPTDAGHYNNWPEETQFFRRESGGWSSPYGEFFLTWYSKMLIDHGGNILSLATEIFTHTSVKISIKIAGIHWHYGTRSHAPELTAGYYNTRFHDGYLPIAQMLAHHGAVFNFTCIEMRDHEQPQDALCAPEKLVKQVVSATQLAQVPLAGENALPRYDEQAHEQILKASTLEVDEDSGERGMCAFTYLRMNPDLFQDDNWRKFMAFVKKMKEGKDGHRCLEQVERDNEHFVHGKQSLIQEAIPALVH